MKNLKITLSILFAMCCLTQVACKNKQNTDNKTTDTEMNIQDLDSLLASYKTNPVYYVDYGNRECLFEIRVNDDYVTSLNFPGTIGGTTDNINQCIRRSGKQKIKIILRPYPGETMIKNKSPFKLEVGFKDFALDIKSNEVRPWNVVWTLPSVEVPEGGIPYFEIEGEFDATVPYVLEDNNEYIDLREIPDIEKRVVAEYNKVLDMIRNKDKESFNNYFANRNNQLGIVFYQTNNDVKYDKIYKWNDILEGIDDFQKIEDYHLEFNNYGRSVALRSNKEDGFSSALLWIKRDTETPEDYEYCSFVLSLGIKKGTAELIPRI